MRLQRSQEGEPTRNRKKHIPFEHLKAWQGMSNIDFKTLNFFEKLSTLWGTKENYFKILKFLQMFAYSDFSFINVDF